MQKEKRSNGRPPMKPGTANTQSIHLKVSENLIDKIEDFCEKNNRNRGEVIRDAINTYIDNNSG